MGRIENLKVPASAGGNDQKEIISAQQLHQCHVERRLQHDVLVTILQLSRLIQRHRGATLAVLGGDKSFRKQVVNIQHQSSFHFEYLQCLNAEQDTALDQVDFQELTLNWLTIIKDWENDDIHHSFEFHSHSIDMISRLSKKLLDKILAGLFIPGLDEGLKRRVEKLYWEPAQNLANTCVLDLFELTEYLARIRGLGTHMAAIGETNEEWTGRITFWLQEFSYRKQRFDQNLNLLPSHLRPHLPGLNQLPSLNMKLNYFVNLLGHEMAVQRTFQVPSHKLFLLGTEIIDGYLNVMDQANAVIRDQFYGFNHMLIEQTSLANKNLDSSDGDFQSLEV